MITIEQLNEAIEEVSGGDTDFIISPDDYYYSDLLKSHRHMIYELGLSFWIAEFFVSADESETIVYIRSEDNKKIIVLQEGLPVFESVEDYLDFLNEIEDDAEFYLLKI